MAKTIQLKDKTFEVTIPESEILKSVGGLIDRLREDYSDKCPVFVIVLSGAFVFASDILRGIDFPYQIAFTKLTSYNGLSSSENIIEQLPVTESVEGRHVVIIEDIVETGLTMSFLVDKLKAQNPASVEICALSAKPEKCKVPGLSVKYVGMNLPEAFIVGYGLDYDGMGRELRDIYSLVSE